MNRIIQYCALAALLLGGNSGAASDVINRYLDQARDYSAISTEPVDARASWLDEPELRYSGNDAEEHGIAFRFRPRFESERRAQNRIVELLNRQHSGQLEARLNDELQTRYLGLIDLIGISSELEYLDANLQLSRLRLEFNRSLVESEDFRIASLQSAEFEFHRAKQLAERYRSRMQRQLQAIDGASPRLLREFLLHWTERVVDWDDIIDTNHRLALAFDDGLIDDRLERTDFELAQQKLKLARSDSASWLKFVELKYVERPGGDQETSLGISIPLGSDDSGISQRAAEVNRSNLSLQQNRLKIARSLSLANRELYWLHDQAGLLDSDQALLTRQHKVLRSANQPELTLDLKLALLDNRKEARQLRLRGLRVYIDLLHSASSLAQSPLTNWLLRDQPPL